MSEHQDGILVAEKICSNFDNANILLPDGSRAHIHLGLSVYPEDGEDISELLNIANLKMNKARMENIDCKIDTSDKSVYLSVES